MLRHQETAEHANSLFMSLDANFSIQNGVPLPKLMADISLRVYRVTGSQALTLWCTIPIFILENLF